MQAPSTWTRSHHINPLTAGAIGLALLAALAIGAMTLGREIEIPLLGTDSEVQIVSQVDPRTDQLLLEQNSWDYVEIAPIDPVLLEENSWDYQPAVNNATVESIRLIEQNSFDYVTPVTVQEIRLDEENAWDWEAAPLVYPEDTGARDY